MSREIKVHAIVLEAKSRDGEKLYRKVGVCLQGQESYESLFRSMKREIIRDFDCREEDIKMMLETTSTYEQKYSGFFWDWLLPYGLGLLLGIAVMI